MSAATKILVIRNGTLIGGIADPNSVNRQDMLEFDAPDFDSHVVDEATLRNNLAELARYTGRKPRVHQAAWR